MNCKTKYIYYFIHTHSIQMDPPKTRREKKKDQREKGAGKDGKYSSKHVRQMEALKRI